MKTYLRILGYARPFADFVPLYFLYTVLGIIFGLCNFTLVIPLLNVLFGTTEQHIATAAPPDFALSIDYIKTTFDYYFTQVTLSRGKLGALSFVCLILIVSVFLSNLFRYLGFAPYCPRSGPRNPQYAPRAVRAHHAATAGLLFGRAERRPDVAPHE